MHSFWDDLNPVRPRHRRTSQAHTSCYLQKDDGLAVWGSHSSQLVVIGFSGCILGITERTYHERVPSREYNGVISCGMHQRNLL